MCHFFLPLFGSVNSFKGAKKPHSQQKKPRLKPWTLSTLVFPYCSPHKSFLLRLPHHSCFPPAFLSLASNSSFFKAFSSISSPCCSLLPAFARLMHFPYSPSNPLCPVRVYMRGSPPSPPCKSTHGKKKEARRYTDVQICFAEIPQKCFGLPRPDKSR